MVFLVLPSLSLQTDSPTADSTVAEMAQYNSIRLAPVAVLLLLAPFCAFTPPCLFSYILEPPHLFYLLLYLTPVAASFPGVASSKALGNNPYEQEMLRKVLLFQEYQADRNVSGLSQLLDDSITTYIPFGSSVVQGKQNVLENWAQFFKTLKWIKERVLGGIEINDKYAAFSKEIEQVVLANDCFVKYHVINWFSFSIDPSKPRQEDAVLIDGFWAIFNLTSIAEQSNCKN